MGCKLPSQGEKCCQKRVFIVPSRVATLEIQTQVTSDKGLLCRHRSVYVWAKLGSVIGKQADNNPT